MSEGRGLHKDVRLALALGFIMASADVFACTVVHDPVRSTPEIIVVTVRTKPGARCTVLDRGLKPPWFPGLEKIGIIEPGRKGRLDFDYRGPEAWSRPRYVYVGRPKATGPDVAILDGTGMIDGRRERVAIRFEIELR